jgi:hypothetical protein
MKTREIKVRANHSKRTFTIRTGEGFKYRTIQMDKDEFNSCLYNTVNDWAQFLRSSDYYKVA